MKWIRFKELRHLSSVIGLSLAASFGCLGLAEALSSRPPFQINKDFGAKFRVAVVGSGIEGSSASYFIRKGLGAKVDIDVYEQHGEIGGRMAVVELDGKIFEAGGAVVHDSNKYLTQFCEISGLKKLKDDENDKMGIYNGEEFLFLSTGYSIIDQLKLFMRYGFGLFKMNSFTTDTIKKFTSIYEVQDKGTSFETVPEFLKVLGGEDFIKLTQETAKKALMNKGISEKIVDELATAVTRCNYGQDMGVNAFTGFVSLAGAQSGKLWAVKGGNYQVCKAILEKAEANMMLNTKVTAISKKTDENQEVKYAVMANGKLTDYMYDVVVVAIPLEVRSDQIQCKECSDWPKLNEIGRFQQTVATFVKGRVNYKAFGFAKESDVPSEIFTVESPKAFFSSLGLLKTVEGKEQPGTESPVYKVFSREILTDAQLDVLFATREEQKVIKWLAYPHYNPPEKFSSFRLDDGVFYGNAIERVASAMEMGAIGGRNSALLTLNYLNKETNNVHKMHTENAKGEL